MRYVSVKNLKPGDSIFHTDSKEYTIKKIIPSIEAQVILMLRSENKSKINIILNKEYTVLALAKG